MSRKAAKVSQAQIDKQLKELGITIDPKTGTVTANEKQIREIALFKIKADKQAASQKKAAIKTALRNLYEKSLGYFEKHNEWPPALAHSGKAARFDPVMDEENKVIDHTLSLFDKNGKNVGEWSLNELGETFAPKEDDDTSEE